MSQPTEPQAAANDDPEPGSELVHIAALLVGRAAALVPHSETDADRLEAILSAMPGLALPEVAALTGQTVSPGVWSIYLQVFAHNWDKPDAKVGARRLVVLRSIQDDTADPTSYSLVNAAVDAMAILADPGDQMLPRMHNLHALATEVDRAGDANLAYDIAAVALDLGSPPGVDREAVASYALNLALKARRAHQVAICAVEVACCRVALAGTDPARRLAAFDACETAMERIWQAPEPVRSLAAERLYRAATKFQWLKLVCAPLLMLSEHADELAQALGAAEWPTRVQRLVNDKWAEQLAIIFDVMRVEQDIEAERIALEPNPQQRQASIDWVDWTLTHRPYRRAVPHHKSFLRERDFDGNVLILIHEMTHALSLLGGIGSALIALRVVGLHNELILWSTAAEECSDSLAQIENEVVAPLPRGGALHLFRAERGLDLTLKAHALQDAWAPWFEGLAVFAEGAADPMADPNNISPIAEALRNLIDFHPTPGASGVFDDQAAIVEQFQAMSAEFEERISKAMTRLGWQRLHGGAALLSHRHYFAGYLAIRAVVASWRRTLERPLSGPEALLLLLHATRFGTFDSVPDLSLPVDMFVTASRDGMARWAANLAGLSAAELEEFLKPPNPRMSRFYVWSGGHLHLADPSDPEIVNLELNLRKRLAQEAQASLSGEADAERLSDAEPNSAFIERAIAERFREWLESPDGQGQVNDDVNLIGTLLTRGSLLPVGRSSSGFYLNLPPDGSNGYLMSRIRTTEAHADTGRPSINGYGFPIPLEAAHRLAKMYEELAIPRLSVTRLIDLGGSIFPNAPWNMHVLAWHHADWVHLQGPTQAVDKFLRQDADLLDWAHDEVRHRLAPTRVERAEMAIARGIYGAQRTARWIDSSESWEIPELGIAVSAWAALVRTKAHRVLDQKARHAAWQAASEVLLQALWGKKALSKNIAGMDYSDLVAGIPPEEVTRAMFRSALRPSPDPWLEANVGRMAEIGLPIFESTPAGWDVRAATIKGT